MKEPDPYCYHCNGTGKYIFHKKRICHCTDDNHSNYETPKNVIDRIWRHAFENAKEPLKTDVYPPHYNDPIMNFVNSLAYGDWFDDMSQKWRDEFTKFASDKLKEHFKGAK